MQRSIRNSIVGKMNRESSSKVSDGTFAQNDPFSREKTPKGD